MYMIFLLNHMDAAIGPSHAALELTPEFLELVKNLPQSENDLFAKIIWLDDRDLCQTDGFSDPFWNIFYLDDIGDIARWFGTMEDWCVQRGSNTLITILAVVKHSFGQEVWTAGVF